MAGIKMIELVFQVGCQDSFERFRGSLHAGGGKVRILITAFDS